MSSTNLHAILIVDRPPDTPVQRPSAWSAFLSNVQRITNAASAVSTPAEGVFLIGMTQGSHVLAEINCEARDYQLSYKLLFVADPNWITQRWEK